MPSTRPSHSHATWDPSSEKCISRCTQQVRALVLLGSLALLADSQCLSDVGDCAQGMGSSALVESCSEAGATTCAYRNALYDGRCFAPSCALVQQGT